MTRNSWTRKQDDETHQVTNTKKEPKAIITMSNYPFLYEFVSSISFHLYFKPQSKA